MSILEWIWLGLLIRPPLWAVISIVSCLLTLEASYLGNIPLPFRVGTVLPIAMVIPIVIVSLEASIITLESPIVVVAMMLVAITIVVVTPMLVKDMATIALRKLGPLVWELRMDLTCTELPLPVFLQIGRAHV